MFLMSLFKNSFVSNREIEAKLLSYKQGSVDWSAQYKITDGSKLEMLLLLPWDILIGLLDIFCLRGMLTRVRYSYFPILYCLVHDILLDWASTHSAQSINNTWEPTGIFLQLLLLL